MIGIKIFKNHNTSSKKKKEIVINETEKLTKEKRKEKNEKFKKEEIIKIFQKKKIKINPNTFSIATLGTGKSYYWLEPKKEC